MEQFRHIGEVLGSLKALMVLHDDIQINQRQCCLIADIFSLAFDTIAEEMRQNLKLEERSAKWKALENPLRELCRVFRDAELYIKYCLDSKDWWGKAIILSHNRDSVEFHIHNLLCYFPAVIEAIENAGEISGVDQDEKEKKKFMLTRKYDMEWNDPKLFQWRFGKQYLVHQEMCKQLENACREDRWRLIEALMEKKNSTKITSTKNEQQLADLLLKKLLNGSDKLNKKFFPSTILLSAKDYQMRRRLGRGSEFKEIQWLGHSFALRCFHGENQKLDSEISTLLSLSHPNILQYLCGFYNDEKSEFLLVMELINKDLWTYMKENYSPRRQILFSIPVLVDLLLQIARGMEYLHSRNIYHGELNPSNIFLKVRNSQEGYFQAKVSGFGLSSVKKMDNSPTSPIHSPRNEEIHPLFWCAPEVLADLEQKGSASNSRYTEKADVYSFAMICFELLTGKLFFEDNHFQGERTNRNIKAGERPLFPYPSPKYLVNLIKKCWHTDPAHRPSFSSICRILRYTKKFLAINTEFLVVDPELNQLELQSPPVDYCDMEAMFLKNFPVEKASGVSSISKIPHEMFAYRVAEKEKTSYIKDKGLESPREESTHGQATVNRDENDYQKKVGGEETASIVEDPLPPAATDANSIHSDTKSVGSEAPGKKTVTTKKQTEVKAKKDQGTTKLRLTRPTPIITPSRSSKINNGIQLQSASSLLSPGKGRSSHVSISERNLKKNNDKGQAPITMSSPSRSKRCVSDSKSSVKFKNGSQTPLARSGGHVSTSKSSLKMKKGNQTPLTMSPLRRTTTDKGNMSPYALMRPLSTGTRGRNGHGLDFDGIVRIIRGRNSPLAMSPLSPHAARATCGHASGYGDSLRRVSLSPIALSPLSPYVTRTSGHVSD